MKNDEDFLEKASRLSRQNMSEKSQNFQHSRKKREFDSSFSFFKFIFRIFTYLICSLFAITGIGGICVFFVLYFLSADLPNHDSLKNYSPQLSTRVFLQDGSKLCEYSNEKRYFIPIDLIPTQLINAFISAEDKNFFEHFGLDFKGILRSAVSNIKQLGSGKRPQGASTITQQVARIFLIKNNDVSYLRKIKEAILAYRMENTLTKKQILELYLNQIYLGLGAYGVAAAAKTYFNKAINELSLAECAYLACLAKGANNYHPIKNKEKAIGRRNWVLSRLLQDNHITQEEYKQALKEDLILSPEKKEEAAAEYFAEEVRKSVMEKYPGKSLNKEGLAIRATLDSRFQKCAYDSMRKGISTVDRSFGWRGPVENIDLLKVNSDEILKAWSDISKPKGAESFQRAVLISRDGKILVEDGSFGNILSIDMKWAKKIKKGDVIFVQKEKNHFRIKQLPQVQGALVVIEVESGRILAMQGGYSFSQSEFNRVTQAKRQVGSAFKPFVYLAGLENGFAPNSILDASPLEIDLGYGLGIWKPKNYHGAILDKITFRQAIERSVNTATIRIAKEVGMDKIARLAEQFGIFEEMPEYFSYAIGAGETTLLKLTTAYAELANGGKKITPTMIDYIFDKNGRILYKADERMASYDNESEYPPKLSDSRVQILNEQSVYQITSILEGVMQRGSAASARCLNMVVAGKTGTSNDSRDTWFIGYTPDIAVGVFIGFDDHTKSLGKNANGANTALPIFIDFMKKVKKYLMPKPFRIPRGIKLRKIDAKTGGAPNGDVTILEAFKQDEEINVENLLENPLKLREEKKEQISTENSESKEAQQVFGIY